MPNSPRTSHTKLPRAGVDADLHVYEGIARAEYARFFGAPESNQHERELGSFLVKRLTKVEPKATQAIKPQFKPFIPSAKPASGAGKPIPESGVGNTMKLAV
jgi:hypothetical protein